MDSLLPNLFVHFFSVSIINNCLSDIHNVLQLLLDVSSGVLVACVANYWLIIPAIAIVLFLVSLHYYFLHASRDVQRIEAIGKTVLTYIKRIATHVSCMQLVVHCIHTSRPQFRD